MIKQPTLLPYCNYTFRSGSHGDGPTRSFACCVGLKPTRLRGVQNFGEGPIRVRRGDKTKSLEPGKHLTAVREPELMYHLPPSTGYRGRKSEPVICSGARTPRRARRASKGFNVASGPGWRTYRI